ncbi:hypothetical protein ACFS2C_06295 [Prauserella oleivorans]|uniref:Uncharacterized protein n=1 Tax=Prauserella oleivorans TaxID=1478153 RepID=A0ABW5W8T9_9PSEU
MRSVGAGVVRPRERAAGRVLVGRATTVWRRTTSTEWTGQHAMARVAVPGQRMIAFT